MGGKPLAARRKVNTMREVKSHMVDARHHKAGRDGPIVVLVPIPVGGSPEPFRQVKPRYPVQQRREHWRPQRAIPSKAAASVNLLRQIIESDAAARSMLRPGRQRRASGSNQTLGTRRLVAATPLSTHCRHLPVSIGTWIVAVLAYADGNCSDARNAETSRLRLRRSTGTEGPCSSRAASISGPPTFLKFQM